MYDFSLRSLVVLEELGHGAFGMVHKVRHKRDGQLMARKTIALTADPVVRTLIERELSVLQNCRSDHVVGFFGSHSDDTALYIYMELMEMSLSDIEHIAGIVHERHMPWIAAGILHGIHYLKTELNVIHRDLKPANILVNTNGDVKLCDLGVSGTLVNSLAKSAVGTEEYMSPERLEGQAYSVRSDIWSMGMVLMELAVGRYPIPPLIRDDEVALAGAIRQLNCGSLPDPSWVRRRDRRERMPPYELYNRIVDDPSPQMPAALFSHAFVEFISQCLVKDDSQRATIDALRNGAFVASALDNLSENQSAFGNVITLLVERRHADTTLIGIVTSHLSSLGKTIRNFRHPKPK